MALKRCLTNLLCNAAKYGRNTTVVIEDAPAELVIRVQDEGPGIPDDMLEHVFEPFFRLESSRNADTGGVGLGLSIARDIAQSHGGSLVLRNRSPHGLEADLDPAARGLAPPGRLVTIAYSLGRRAALEWFHVPRMEGPEMNQLKYRRRGARHGCRRRFGTTARSAGRGPPHGGPGFGGPLDIDRVAILLDLDPYQKGEVQRVLTAQREAMKTERQQRAAVGRSPASVVRGDAGEAAGERRRRRRPAQERAERHADHEAQGADGAAAARRSRSARRPAAGVHSSDVPTPK